MGTRHRLRTRTRGLLGAGTLLLLGTIAHGRAGTEEVAEILRREAPPQDNARALLALGPSAIGTLFEIHASGWIEPTEPLNPGARGALWQALRAQDPDHLRAFLQNLSQPLPQAHARDAVALIGTFGLAEDLVLLANLASPVDEAPLPVALRTAFEEALVQLLTRDATSQTRLPALYGQAHPGLLGSIVQGIDAIGKGDPRQAVILLAGLLDKREGLDLYLLTRIARLSQEVVFPIEPAALQPIRHFLSWGEPSEVQLAASSLARLNDYGSVGELVSLLSSTAGNVRSAGLRSLREISGLSLDEAEQWQAWFVKEESWFDNEFPRIQRELSSNDPALVARALRQVATRRLHRDALALEATGALKHPQPAIAHLASVALGQLGSGVALESLAAAANRPEPQVSRAARAAYERITGKAFPGH